MSFLQRVGVLRYVLQLLAFSAYGALGAVLQNITLPLPPGTTNNGTPGLLCTPTRWTDVASFYLFNYVAHAATVITRPGERSIDFAVTVVGSLLFPAIGLYRGIEAILCGALFGNRDEPDADLRRAAKSGALCMVARSPDWRPREGDVVQNAIIKRGEDTTDTFGRRDSTGEDSLHLITYQAPWTFSRFGRPIYVHRQIIHGAYALPPGYRFVIIPPDVRFRSVSVSQTIEVAATFNMVKALVALAQTGYASITLYRSRGDQITKFGFAAFGLTVAPYAVMSIMNLVGNICRPDYASLYMIESSIMDEARARGGTFYGTIGRVKEQPVPSVTSYATDAEHIHQLKFSKEDDGRLTASVGMQDSARPWEARDTKDEKSFSDASMIMKTNWHIRDIPNNRDYTGTEKDILVLVPSANPLTSPAHSPDDVIIHHRIDSLILTPNSCFWPWKRKSHSWALTFSSEPNTKHPFRWRFVKFFLTTVIALLPLLVTGLMSHFQPGTVPASRSASWKSYVLQWLLMGVFTGIWFVLEQEAKDAAPNPTRHLGPTGRVLAYILSASPAIGGFVVVGQMLNDYGSCIWIGN